MTKAFNRLPPSIKDALAGLLYALVISLVVLLSYSPGVVFRYLSL